MVYVFQRKEHEIVAPCVLHRGETTLELSVWVVGSLELERNRETC